eukprot:1613066-Rhodomonas_salina.5
MGRRRAGPGAASGPAAGGDRRRKDLLDDARIELLGRVLPLEPRARLRALRHALLHGDGQRVLLRRVGGEAREQCRVETERVEPSRGKAEEPGQDLRLRDVAHPHRRPASAAQHSEPND